MGFYDVKNAKLLERQGLRMRWEPGIDEDRVKRFVSMMESIAKPGEDFCWILAGSSDTAAKKITAALTQKGATWKFKQYYFVYDAKQLQKWYWTRMRGLANSKNCEKAFLCWKGTLPKHMPRDRLYVDTGSGLYVNTMLKVPVLAPKDLTFVDREVLEASMKGMAGVLESTGVDTHADDSMEPVAASAAVDEGAEPASLVHHVKKRKLYRHATGEEVEWFPLDNAPDLLRELVWECGGTNVRWVLHGTPASGAGVIGCLEMGCSVVCLCEDAHHKENFQKALKERAVERLIAGSRIFKDPGLSARALDLLPGAAKEEKDQKEAKKKDDEKEDKKSEAKKKDEKDGKNDEKDGTKHKKRAKGGKKKKCTKKEAKEKKDGKAKAESKKRKRDEEAEEPEDDEDDEEYSESSSEEDADEEE